MSWNRLLGYMIKSGSLLSANQPSCHPVKQTLNRFFGCMPRAVCQPDMWTFTKKIPCPSLLPNVTFPSFPFFCSFCFYIFLSFCSPLLHVFYSILSPLPETDQHFPSSHDFAFPPCLTLQWQSCSSARLRSEPKAKWSGCMRGIGSTECLVHCWIMYLLSAPKQGPHIAQARPNRTMEAVTGFTLHKLRYRFCCRFQNVNPFCCLGHSDDKTSSCFFNVPFFAFKITFPSSHIPISQQ